MNTYILHIINTYVVHIMNILYFILYMQLACSRHALVRACIHTDMQSAWTLARSRYQHALVKSCIE